jgi:hypothetical protein
VLAPRPDGRRFNKMSAFLDPLIDLPLETVSYLKWRVFQRPPLKKRLSLVTALPLGMMVWGAAFGAIDTTADQWALQGLQSSLSAGDFGAAYTSEWVLSGSLSAPAALSYLRDEQRRFTDDLQPLRTRVAMFQELGLWNAEQAHAVSARLDRLRATHSARDLFHAETLWNLLMIDAAVGKLSKELSESGRFTLELLVQPSMEVRGQSDAYWLSVFFDSTRQSRLSPEQQRGLRSLRGIYEAHRQDLSLATLTKLVAETLSDGEAIRTKLTRARELGLPATYDFIYRADIPLFSVDETFNDLNGDISIGGELDRWRIILTDSRFQDLRTSWERGELSELAVLLEAEMQMRALGDINLVHRHAGETLDAATACRLIFGRGEEPANPLFSSLSDLNVRLGLSAEQIPVVPSVQYDLAQIYYSTFLAAEKTTDSSARAALFAAGREKEAQAYASIVQGTYRGHAVPSCQ